MGYVMDRRKVADQHQPPEQLNRFLNCPRCNSTNTKFCYYNNYSLSQPRHFCKTCKRYWTRGGTLRNVPVGGGGCRKNIKRVRKPPSSASSLSLLADAPPSSSNQISQMGTSMAAAADGATDNLLAPLFYSLAGMSSSYEDLIKQQHRSFSDMNVGSIDDPTDSFLSGYNNRISLRLPPPPSSVYLQDKDSGVSGQDTNNRGQLRQKLFPFQAMQQEQPRSTTLAGGHLPEDPQARRWNNNHVDHHHRDQNDQRHNSSVYWAGQLADMDS